MENIAESAGLAHTADVMYALIQDAMMHANREYWLKVLKIRDGQGKGSRCRYNIDYDLLSVNQEHETRRLINYLDLKWESGCLNPQDNK